MTIGIFDSGMGGLTVLSEAIRRIPMEDYYFVADTLHVPYGTKSKEEVHGYILDTVHDMMKHDIDALVIACNTATSIAVETLREEYPNLPIIGMEPAVKPAVEMNHSTGRRVLVFATPLTLSLPKYYALVSRVDDSGIVDSLPMEKLVPFCESMKYDTDEVKEYFLEQLAPFDLEDYGIIVLGCTHYPYFKPLLREILPSHIDIVDGSTGTVRRLAALLHRYGMARGKGSGKVVFHNTNEDKIYNERMKDALTYLQHNQL
ncbi:glutamate racemase [Paenibacillus endoradicis]|uniref:glutamate racemase n=1 Tax=Paenibacillus endoradicis TaxID=2972487 RepID=UPI002158FB06|nr:glutamate racemase [Paenibacillus endoradicis]MCR8659050.1 glutamate racemase [Paenibacillus endoradicis]